MALTGGTVQSLTTALCSPSAAKEIATALNASVASPATVIAAIGAVSITAIGTTSNITAVPGSFADAAAVQTYLAAAGVVPRIESRLDTLEAQCDLISPQVNTVNAKVDALIAALKVAGIMASS